MNVSTPRLTRAGLSALVLIVALLVTSETSSGQEVTRGQNDTSPAEAPVLRAAPVPAGQGVDLDGYLGEAAWQTATPITEFKQQDPVEGAEPTEASEIRILIDGVALYIGAMFFDDPDGILAYQKRRDEGLGTDDRFMWILDTFLDGRTGYFFEINPAGLMGDGLLRAGGNVNKAWDGVWEARVQRLDNGWSAEIQIPWSTLNFNPESDTWGINFQRTIRRKREGFGIGADTAAERLIIFGDTPDRIHAEAAFAKLCGACPIPASSGMTTGRHRLYRGGPRQANAALHRAVIVRMQFHTPTPNDVERRTAEGRPKQEIIRCLTRFLAREIVQRVMADSRARQAADLAA